MKHHFDEKKGFADSFLDHVTLIAYQDFKMHYPSVKCTYDKFKKIMIERLIKYN